MKKRIVPIALALVAALALFPLAAAAQATYNGGKSGGQATLYSGDVVIFTPGANPTPNGLWIGVVGGSGPVIIRDGAGHQTNSMTINSGQVLLFQNTPPIYFQFQGTSLQFFWGGTLLDKPPAPICDTGIQGPVLVMVNKLLNFLGQSSDQGTPKLTATVYLTNTVKTNGDLSYTDLSNWQSLGTYAIPTCSGSECCNPKATVLPLKNISGSSFTVYEIDTVNGASIDWDTAVPSPLTCTASASPTSGLAPLSVTFQSAAAGGSSGYDFEWKFGDGATASKQNPTHSYTTGGTFTWKMTVTDAANVSCTKTGTIQVTSPLSVITSASPRQGPPPLTVTFGAIGSGGTPPYTYAWDFDDGSSATTPAPTHTFINQGAYQCRVVVKDSQNRSVQGMRPVYVGVPIPPTVTTVSALSDPFRLKVQGTDFVTGCTATIDGAAVPLVQYKDTMNLIFKGSGLKPLVPKGRFVCIVVTNPDGGANDCFYYQR